MSLPTSRKPHKGGRWKTIRYALDTNPRTFRLCLILLAAAVPSCLAVLAAELFRHMMLWASRAQAVPGSRKDRRGSAARRPASLGTASLWHGGPPATSS
jgi:hypothetical protein